MKTTKYLFLAAAAMAFAACSNDDENLANGPVEARISASIDGVKTRAAETSWNAGDQIGISCDGGKTNYTNVLYTISNVNTGSFTSETPIYFQDLEEVTFSAYYPYAAAGGTITKTIAAADQEEETQKKIDYMYASGATASRQSPEVKFTNEGGTDARFKHCMSRLSFTFNQGADTDLKDMTDFTVSGLKMTGTFDTTDGTASADETAQAANLKITETPGESTGYTRSLILFPQSVAGGEFSLSLTLGGQIYQTELSIPQSGTALTKGCSYTYTITVNKTAISVSQATIEDWNNGGSSTGEATMQ